NLSLSIYLQSFSNALFGKAIAVVRGTSAFISVLSAFALALVLHSVFRNRFWWAAPLVIGVLPCWFLHSRTGFETVMMVSFYACFICSYLMYRYYSSRWIYAAVLCGGATFYAYANGQGLIAITCLLLFICDFRYHWKQGIGRKIFTCLLLLVVCIPYLRMRMLIPGSMVEHLTVLNSYWLNSELSFFEKFYRYFSIYLQGLSYSYWFDSTIDAPDNIRHRIKEFGHLPLSLLPFILIGLLVSIGKSVKSAAHRTVLIAVLAVPFTAALVHIHIPRVLAMVVPVTLLVCIGFDACYYCIKKWVRVAVINTCLGSVLVLSNLALLFYCLQTGYMWSADYALYGFQWGAKQVFGAVEEELRRSDSVRVVVSHTWANNPNVFAEFFLDEELTRRTQINTIEPYEKERVAIPEDTLFVVSHYEYESLQKNSKFLIPEITRTVYYPDRRPGFYFIKLKYAAGEEPILIDQVLQQN
ncbi:hypothetical protein OAO01_08305, partial [Oligoflexia bacterium]|nr:hypothetical protein [Oligoflexia bacterium]